MFLTVNHSEGSNNNNNRDFPTITEGVYQAIIKEAEITKSSAGNDMIKITLVIRDDVQQQFAKRKVWDYLVYSDRAKWKLQQVAKAVQIPNGKNINTIQEFAKEILYKPVTIDIKHEQDTYNGETKIRERVSFYDVSEAPTTTSSTSTDPFTSPSNSTSTNVSPF